MTELQLNGGRRDAEPMRVNWNAIGVLVTVAMLLLGGLLSISGRVTALENQSKNDSQRMQRIEDMVFQILQRVK